MQPCCNDKCVDFSYFFEKNCDRGVRQTSACHQYVEMKKKDPETPAQPGVNEKFIVIDPDVEYIYMSDTLAAAEEAITSEHCRIFRIVQAIEYKNMGWDAQESYQDDYTNTKGV